MPRFFPKAKAKQQLLASEDLTISEVVLSKTFSAHVLMSCVGCVQIERQLLQHWKVLKTLSPEIRAHMSAVQKATAARNSKSLLRVLPPDISHFTVTTPEVQVSAPGSFHRLQVGPCFLQRSWGGLHRTGARTTHRADSSIRRHLARWRCDGGGRGSTCNCKVNTPTPSHNHCTSRRCSFFPTSLCVPN